MTSSPPARQRRRLALRLLGALIALLLVGYIGLSTYIADQLTRTTRRALSHNPQAEGIPVEDVTFRSLRDDVTLSGWLFPAANDQSRLIILVHGFNSVRDDGGVGLYDVAQALIAEGFSVLSFDLRGYGKSEGTRFSLAYYEQQDVRGAIRYAQSRGFQHIGVMGYSMGAASTLLAAADEPGVKAVVEDSGYAELSEVLGREIPERSGLPGVFTPGVIFMARLMFGVDAYAVRPDQAAARLAPRPLLVIHGAADDFIPTQNAALIWHARYGAGEPDPATYLIMPGAEHVKSFNTNRAEYIRRVSAFFDQHLR